MDTKGWDTINLIKLKSINEAIKFQWTQDKADFYQSLDLITRPNTEPAVCSKMGEELHGTKNSQINKMPAAPADNDYLKGKFGCVQIVTGGSGKNVRLEFPIISGEMKIEGKSYDLSGTNVIVETVLSIFDTGNSSSIVKTAYKRVAVHCGDSVKSGEEDLSPSNDDDKEGLLYPLFIEVPDERFGVYKDNVLDGVCNYLVKNSDQLSVTFAEVNFANSQGLDWAVPKKYTYSYLDCGYLAILAVCDDRSIDNLHLDVDLAGIELEGDSFYLMSPEMLLKHLILPGLVPIYENASINNFTFSSDEFCNNADLNMRKIKSGAILYAPKVKKGDNKIFVEGERAIVSYKGYCDMKANITMNWSGRVNIEANLINEDSIAFSVSSREFQHSQHIPWYEAWLLPIVGEIIQIVVSIISDDLIAAIVRNASSIRADRINCVQWGKKKALVKFAGIDESFIIKYSLQDT